MPAPSHASCHGAKSLKSLAKLGTRLTPREPPARTPAHPSWISIAGVLRAAERWPSGRRRRFAKPLYGVNPYRGFEIPSSPPFIDEKPSKYGLSCEVAISTHHLTHLSAVAGQSSAPGRRVLRGFRNSRKRSANRCRKFTAETAKVQRRRRRPPARGGSDLFRPFRTLTNLPSRPRGALPLTRQHGACSPRRHRATPPRRRRPPVPAASPLRLARVRAGGCAARTCRPGCRAGRTPCW